MDATNFRASATAATGVLAIAIGADLARANSALTGAPPTITFTWSRTPAALQRLDGGLHGGHGDGEERREADQVGFRCADGIDETSRATRRRRGR